MFFQRLIESGFYEGIEDRDKFRIRFVNALALAFIPLYIIYIYVNYSKGFYGFALLDATNVVVLLSTYFFLRYTGNIEKASYGLLLSPIPIFIMAFFEGGIHNTAFFWFFLYPLWAIFLKGNRKGPRWIAGLYAMIIAFYAYATINNITLPYDKVTLIILMVALTVETFVVMYYENVRKKYDDIIIKQNRELDEYRSNLEEKVVAQEQELIEIQRDIIFTMGSIGESRSKETGNHVNRVAGYSRLFAELLEFSDDEIAMIYQASPMHDIGKVGIPDGILHKPGKLTTDEFEIMKTHADLGYEMLKNSNRTLLNMAATIAYEHHEKYNGNGYPRGLVGEDIHIYGRITAIADVFDALGSERVYKSAWKMEDVLALLQKERGEHFDPMLIDLFFANISSFIKIRDQYKD
jgi:putative two-component system response regulator